MSQDSKTPEQSTASTPKLGRRSFLAAAAAATGMAGTALSREYGPGAAPTRYPEPDVVVLDDRFKKYKLGNSPILRLYHSKKMLLMILAKNQELLLKNNSTELQLKNRSEKLQQ